MNACARPFLTIAIPTFNRASHLHEAMDAILRQVAGRRDVELLVCDNASPDCTAEVVGAFQGKSASVRYHRNNTNLGLGGNVITAYRLALGTYVWFLTDDDLIVDGAVDAIVRALAEKHPQVMTVSTDAGGTTPVDDVAKTGEEYLSWRDANAATTFLGAVLLPIVIARKADVDIDSLLARSNTSFPQVTLCLELLKQRCHFLRMPIAAIVRNPGVRCRDLFELYCLELRTAIRMAGWADAEETLLRATEGNLKDFVRLQICERAGLLESTSGLPMASWKKGWTEFGGRLGNKMLLILILLFSRAPRIVSKAIYGLHLLRTERSISKATRLYRIRRLACASDRRASDV